MPPIGLVWTGSSDFSLSEPAGTWIDPVGVTTPADLCPLATGTRSRVAWLAAAVITITPALDVSDENLVVLTLPTGSTGFVFTDGAGGSLAVATSGSGGSVVSTGTAGNDPNLGGDFRLRGLGTSQPYSFTGSISAALWYDDQTAQASPATTFNTQLQGVIPTVGANTGVNAGGTFNTSPVFLPPTFRLQAVLSGAAGHNTGGASTPVFDSSWTTIISHTNGDFYTALAWVPSPYTSPQTFTWSLSGNSSVDWGLLSPGDMLYDGNLPTAAARTRSFAVVIGD